MRRVSVVPFVALASMMLGGCVAPQPAPVYAPAPPPPRALTIYPQGGQSQRQQDRDKADCQSLASRDASSSDSWAQIFAGCMGGRGYRVE